MDRGRTRDPGRAQSSVIGVVLIIGMTLAAASAVVMFGGAALDDGRQQSEIGQAEQAMTQFDSRAAQVALGESDVKTIDLGRNSGSYRIEEDAGRVRLLHENWNGSETDYTKFEDEGSTVELYNASLGALVMETSGTEVAYQGGGVWRKDGEGPATMVSSPEFHYRSATVTFPLVRVQGSGTVSGSSKARVSRVETARDIYPNRSARYPNGDSLENPVVGGNMTIEVTSRYCEGWQNYLLDRTDGEVSACDENGTVTADIVASSEQGLFDPTEGGEIEVIAFNEFESFTVTLRETGNSKMNNIEWALQDEEERFEVHMDPGNKNDCGDPADVAVYYSNDGKDTYHTWVNDSAFTFTCPDDDIEITIDLQSDVNMTYEEYDGVYLGTTSFNGTEYIAGKEYSANDQTSLKAIMEEYFDRLGDSELQVMERQGNGNPASLSSSSSGTMYYRGDSGSVTYLHVTENRVQIDLSR